MLHVVNSDNAHSNKDSLKKYHKNKYGGYSQNWSEKQNQRWNSLKAHPNLPSDFEEQYPQKHPQPSGTHQGYSFHSQPDIVVIIKTQRLIHKTNIGRNIPKQQSIGNLRNYINHIIQYYFLCTINATK